MLRTDFVIAGGGCVGLATAYNLLKKYPGKRLVVLEKERKVASHQTGRNSGVIHSGIYYKPGSFKAINCRKGKKALEQFCRENDVPFEVCGKVIVATKKEQGDTLHDIYQRGKSNGVDCKLITRAELLKIEPQAAGIAAIHVPETGIVDYKQVCKCLVQKIKDMGGSVHRCEKVVEIEGVAGNLKNSLLVTAKDNTGFDWVYHCDAFINCGGLYADHIARAAGIEPQAKIIPFRGEYYTLTPEAEPMVKGLIYPVPDPRFPFLGVHFTKMVDGSVECGPNAVLAFGRECYKKYQFSISELWETLTFPGFWKIAFKYWRTGADEMLRSLFKGLYTKSLKELLPAIESRHLVNDRPAGIRAQAVLRDGTLVDDFLIEKQGNIVHVLNAPSPAATACLTIGEQVVSKLEE